jgi:hypothetical protein
VTDDLPTPERLRRIERGVQQRLAARRATRQSVLRGVTGVVVAAVVIGGGFALLRPGSNSATSGSAGGSAARASSAPLVPIECHRGKAITTTQADPAGLPASALAACAAAGRTAAAEPLSGNGPAASASPSARTLCRTKDGVLHVYPGLPAVCATHGMAPYPG